MELSPSVETSSRSYPATVVSGRGRAAKQFDWAHPDIVALLNATPIAGTMNVVLDVPVDFALPPEINILGGKAFFWKAKIGGIACLAYRWKTCPLHVVELIASCHMRTNLGLVDGSRIEVELPALARLSFSRRLAWKLLWNGRGAAYYRNDDYISRVRRLPLLFAMSNQTRPHRR